MNIYEGKIERGAKGLYKPTLEASWGAPLRGSPVWSSPSTAVAHFSLLHPSLFPSYTHLALSVAEYSSLLS